MGNLIVVIGSIVAILLAISGAIGGWAVFRSSRNTAIVTNYKQAADSYRERTEAQEIEIGDLKKTNSHQAEQIAELQGKIKVLEGIASGREAVEELHRHMSDALTAITKQIATAQGTVISEIRLSREIYLHGRIGEGSHDRTRGTSADS